MSDLIAKITFLKSNIKSGFSICFLFILILFNSCFSISSMASDLYIFDSKEKEEIFSDLIVNVRCTVCPNQNIDGSNSLEAKEIKDKIALMVRRGDTSDTIIDRLRSEYGDSVYYAPSFNIYTIVLWTAPFIIFLMLFCLSRSSNTKVYV